MNRAYSNFECSNQLKISVRDRGCARYRRLSVRYRVCFSCYPAGPRSAQKHCAALQALRRDLCRIYYNLAGKYEHTPHTRHVFLIVSVSWSERVTRTARPAPQLYTSGRSTQILHLTLKFDSNQNVKSPDRFESKSRTLVACHSTLAAMPPKTQRKQSTSEYRLPYR